MNSDQNKDTRASGHEDQSTDSKPTSLLLLALIIFSPTLCFFGILLLASMPSSYETSAALFWGGLIAVGVVSCIAAIYCTSKLLRGEEPDGQLALFFGVLFWFAILLVNAFVTFAICATLKEP